MTVRPAIILDFGGVKGIGGDVNGDGAEAGSGTGSGGCIGVSANALNRRRLVAA